MQKQIETTTTGPKPVDNNMSNNMYQGLEGLPEHSMQYSQVARVASANENSLFHCASCAICEYCLEGSGKPSRHRFMLLDMLLSTGFGPVVQ